MQLIQFGRICRIAAICVAVCSLASVAFAQKNPTMKAPQKGVQIIIKIMPSSPLVGTWRLQAASKDLSSTKVVFRNDGSFRFYGGSWTSGGRYEVNGSRLRLTWTEIDGERVEKGTICKDIYLDGDSFRIDRFTYFKD